MKTHKFKIGTQFTRVTGKRKSPETITDLLTTKNSKGEVVQIRYVATHDFMGQTVTDHDVLEVTIARALAN